MYHTLGLLSIGSAHAHIRAPDMGQEQQWRHMGKDHVKPVCCGSGFTECLINYLKQFSSSSTVQ